MPLNGNQIVAQACQNASVPGFTSQAQALLQVILDEMCQTYDFALARKTLTFNLPTAVDSLGRAPMVFPADYLRAKPEGNIYFINNVPYALIPVDLTQLDQLVTTPGLQNFPTVFATDVSVVPPIAYFWMPPSGAYPAQLRYQCLVAPITDFTTVPWFPFQNYLLTRLTGELFKITDDERTTAFLSYDEDRFPEGAGSVLRRILKMKEDEENRTKRVKLDRQYFGPAFDRLRNTKQVGW